MYVCSSVQCTCTPPDVCHVPHTQTTTAGLHIRYLWYILHTTTYIHKFLHRLVGTPGYYYYGVCLTTVKQLYMCYSQMPLTFT
jgi:hypothetical protein